MNNENFDSQFADNVARLCYEKFEKLPKSGKPVEEEWTYLAAIVKHCNEGLEVVSIATGSKCIGESKLSPSGDVVNDSHAEVLARRGFLKYLYEQIKNAKSPGKSDLLIKKDDGKYGVRQSVTFHLFSSHVPCGDAAIFAKYEVQVIRQHVANNSSEVVTLPEEVDLHITKKKKIDVEKSLNYQFGNVIDDIHRTGAKCLAEDKNSDMRLPGAGYHVVGRVRTKPGRGDPTLSVSCSDKILRWNCVGIQGALLSLLLDSIYLSSIVIGNHESLYSKEALHRAVVDRNTEIAKIVQRPVLLHSSLEFKFCKRLRGPSAKPAPCGIVWCSSTQRNPEVIVEGRFLGWTKKTCSRVKPLSISKKVLLHTFKALTDNIHEDCSYLDAKRKATSYQNSWKHVKIAVGMWTQKNHDLIKFK